MSIITEKCFGEIKGDFLSPTDDCFHCGNKLSGFPIVMWDGFPMQIWLHVNCVRGLTLGLMRDYNEIQVGKEVADEMLRRDKE